LSLNKATTSSSCSNSMISSQSTSLAENMGMSRRYETRKAFTSRPPGLKGLRRWFRYC
jgi:hypothetical protein